MGELGRYLVSLTKGVGVSKFGVKKLVLNIFLLSSIYRSILVGINRGSSVADSRLQQIFLISFLKDLTIS